MNANSNASTNHAGFARTPSSWAWRIGIVALVGAGLALILAVVPITMARYDMIGKLTGFLWFFKAQSVAGVSAIIAALALIIGLIRKSGPKWPSAIALVVCATIMAVALFMVIIPASRVPKLHDITTNVDNPPQFHAIKLRTDDLVPFKTEAQWKAALRAGYPNIKPIIIDRNPQQVLSQARTLVEMRGWKLVSFDPQAGQLEAIAYAGYPRFHDDVLVKVTPIADGSTRVDMRSVSEVGVSDLGYNARRIERFLADLQKAET